MTYVLPGTYPDDHPHPGGNSVNAVAKARHSAWLQNPFLFNTMLWLACIQRDLTRGSKISYNSPPALSYKVNGIRQLNEILSNGRKALTDEVILTIVVRASHKVIKATEKKMKPFNSPLKSAGGLNAYAIIRLIALRGGIENLTLPGLAEGILIGEITGVINSFLKPVYPPLRFHEPYITSVKAWANSPPRSVQRMGKAFRQLPEYGLIDSMLEVFDCMGAITMTIDHYLQGKQAGLTLGQIVRTRTGIQKRLLVLPTGEELKTNIIPSSSPNFYECCRLTAMIFSVAVIFPIPNTFDVLQTLVRGIKAEIEVRDFDSYNADCSKIFLWILVLGGIVALGKL